MNKYGVILVSVALVFVGITVYSKFSHNSYNNTPEQGFKSDVIFDDEVNTESYYDDILNSSEDEEVKVIIKEEEENNSVDTAELKDYNNVKYEDLSDEDRSLLCSKLKLDLADKLGVNDSDLSDNDLNDMLKQLSDYNAIYSYTDSDDNTKYDLNLQIIDNLFE